MQFIRYLALLAWMVIPFPLLVCVRDAHSTARQPAQVQPPAACRGDGQREVLCRANAAAARAAVLRQQQTGREMKAAIALLEESVQLFKAAHSYGDAARMQLQIGDTYFTLSEYEKALATYREVIALSMGDQRVRCQALSRMSRVYSITGRTADADRYSNQAVDLSRSFSDATVQAEALAARGLALYVSGDFTHSAELLARARELFVQAANPEGQAQSALWLAYALFGSERLKAIQLAGEALRLWSSSNSRDGIARAHSALGFFAAVAGEFETAQCNYQQALDDFRSIGDKDNEAVALNGIGYTNRENGDLPASLESYRRAKAIFADLRDPLGAGEATTGIGKALSAMGRYRQLLPVYREKLRLAQETKSPAQVASALADMAGAYELEGQLGKAETLYRRSLATYRSVHHEHGEGEVLIRLAHLLAGQGRFAQAISLLETARSLKDKAGQVEEVARIQYELARIYRQLGRLEDARAAIEKTIAIIESQRLKIAAFDSRAAYFASVHRYYALYIQVLMLLKQRDPAQGFLQSAFEASERSKVRALLDLLTASSQSSHCDELLEQQLSPDHFTDSSGAGTGQSLSAGPVLTLHEIQAEIANDGTVLLEYALGDEKSYVWVVDQQHIVAHELPGADQVRKMVEAFLSAVTARQRLPAGTGSAQRLRALDAASSRLGRQLSRMVLGPAALGRAKRLLIVPDGSLQYIPFSALPLPEAVEKNASLVSHYEVLYLPSGSALGTLRKTAANNAPPSSLAAIFADPVFERDDPRVPRASGSQMTKPQRRPSDLKVALRDAQKSQYIERLPGSHEEAEAIRKIFSPQDVLVAEGFDASKAFVLQGALKPYRYIHFATHGIIDSRHPEMSGLILSLFNQKGGQQDGYLRLGEIYNLKLSADLVVLSGCNSALGKDLDSEGIIGLPRGLLHAGARSVIASLWKVDDDAAAEFMRGLYARIEHGENPASALRGAQIEMSIGNRWRAPFYWAAFVLQGDYK